MKISRERFNQLVTEAYREVLAEALPTTTQEIYNEYPIVRKYLSMLHGPNFEEFVETVENIVPEPTTFRVTITNGQHYDLEWNQVGPSADNGYFIAIVAEKRYNLEPGNPEITQAKDKMKDEIFKTAPMGNDGEEDLEADLGDDDTPAGGGGGGDDAFGGAGDLGGPDLDDEGEGEEDTAPDFDAEPESDI